MLQTNQSDIRADKNRRLRGAYPNISADKLAGADPLNDVTEPFCDAAAVCDPVVILTVCV